MKFIVNSKVTVKEDLLGNEYYGTVYFNPDMRIYRGKEFIIKNIYYNEYDNRNEIILMPNTIYPYVDEWIFSEEMLSPSVSYNKVDLESL